MKKIIFSALFFGIFLVACEKNDTNLDALTESSTTMERSDSDLRVYYDNGKVPGVEGVDYGCKGSGGSCLPTITVDLPTQQVITHVLEVVDLGDNEAISETFSTFRETLTEVISSDLVSGVATGALNVKNRGDFSTETSAYLQFSTLEGELVNVAQLKK